MELFFYFMGAWAILSAICVITFRNPVRAAMALFSLFAALAAIYVALSAEFLAAVQIFVYAGGILLLYVFVIMLITLKDYAQREKAFHPAWFLGVFVVAGLFYVTFQLVTPDLSLMSPPLGEYPQQVMNEMGGNTMAPSAPSAAISRT